MDQLDTLYDAAIAGDAIAIAKLEMEADILNKDEQTILHTESANGNTERVRFILREFASKNLLVKLTKYKYTALHWAVYCGHTEVAEMLIDAARQLPSSSSSSSSANDDPLTSFQGFLRQPDYRMYTALHAAAMEGNVAIVKLLVEADPADRHIQNNEGKTPMYIAVELGFNEIVEIISTTCTAPSLDGPDGTALRINNLDQVNSPGGTRYQIMDKDAWYAAGIAGDADAIAILEMETIILNEYDETILHVESKLGNTERVRFILREFANRNLLTKVSKHKFTALHLAAYHGHTEVAEALVDAARDLPPFSSANEDQVTSFQAFLRQGDKDMDTALHLAVTKGQVAIVKLLADADPTDRHSQNDQGETPMYIAVENGFNDIVEIISTTCIAPSLDGPYRSTALRIQNLDQVKSPGGTLYKIMERGALYDAAIAGDADAIAKLEMEADILNKDEQTILHTESTKGNTKRVRFILREFASKNLLVKLDNLKWTALHLAAYNGFTEVAEVLVDAARHLPSSSANDNTQENRVTSFQAFLRQANNDMDTALHVALRKGEVAIAKLLIESDSSDRHFQNKKGKTPIYIAAKKGYNDIVKLICTKCTAPLNLDGPGRSTALHVAIKNRHHGTEVVEVLIAAVRFRSSSSHNDSTNDNKVSSFQTFLRQGDEVLNTALHIAVMQGNLDTAKLLVEADPSDPHIPNHQGKSPIYIAVEKGYANIVNMMCTTCTAPSLDGPGGSTALHAALKIHNQGIEVVEVLIAVARLLFSASDDDITRENAVSSFQAFLRRGDEDLNTALHIAVMQGNLAAAKLLVETYPDDVDIRNDDAETPIYIAVEKGYTDIVKMICTTCAAPSLYGPREQTVLHAVIKYLDEGKKEVRDVIKIIIDLMKRAIFQNKNIKDKEYRVHRCIVEGMFSITDEYGETILELAVERNYTEVVELILDVHNPAYRDDWIGDDFISLMPLIYKAKDKEYKNIFKLLTERYDAGAQFSSHLKNQVNLISAIRKGKKDYVLFYLLDDPAQHLVTFVDKLGWTALHHAAYHEFNSIIEPIIEAQKLCGHQFVYKDMVSTPFHVAAQLRKDTLLL